MNVRATGVILTDTKSLSRFSVMKFSSVNVQSSAVFRLPLLSFKGATLAFTANLSPSKFAWLAPFSHSHAHLYEHKHIWVRTQRQVTH